MVVFVAKCGVVLGAEMNGTVSFQDLEGENSTRLMPEEFDATLCWDACRKLVLARGRGHK
jgi:hypothetical protein